MIYFGSTSVISVNPFVRLFWLDPVGTIVTISTFINFRDVRNTSLGDKELFRRSDYHEIKELRSLFVTMFVLSAHVNLRTRFNESHRLQRLRVKLKTDKRTGVFEKADVP